MPAPLLEADAVRIDEAGAPAVDRLTLSADGPRVAIFGAARALFEAACGVRPIAHGALRVGGESPASALSAAHVAGAPRDVPMPPKWTVAAYVTWSARLAAGDRATRARRIAEAIASLRLEPLASTKLRDASLAVRRATVIAGALATGAEIVVLEDPCEGLEDDPAATFGETVARALAARRWLLFGGRFDAGSPLARAADEAVWLDGSEVIARGAPDVLATKARSYALAIRGDAARFADALRAHGVGVDAPESAPSRRLVVELGDAHTTRDLLEAAAASDAVILELRPFVAPPLLPPR